MQVELSKDELVLILDGLAQLPLVRSFNTFQRLVAVINEPPLPVREPPLPVRAPSDWTAEDHPGG